MQKENEYPLCHHCRTVKKFGPVLKRKRRTIIPRKQKPKNKKRKPTIEVIDEEESDEDPELFEDNEDGQEVSDYQKQLEDNFGVEDEETFGLNQEEVEEVTSEEEENFSNSNSSPITGEVAVEDLLEGSDED